VVKALFECWAPCLKITQLEEALALVGARLTLQVILCKVE